MKTKQEVGEMSAVTGNDFTEGKRVSHIHKPEFTMTQNLLATFPTHAASRSGSRIKHLQLIAQSVAIDPVRLRNMVSDDIECIFLKK